MSTSTKIEWADATWNPVVGCTRVSEGCRHCYAERFAARFPDRFGHVSQMTEQGPRWTGKVVLRPEVLYKPLRWRKPRKIFVNSMSDLFHETVPDEFIAEVFAVMTLADRHVFQVLTKRPERMAGLLPRLPDLNQTLRVWVAGGGAWPLPNVWLGVSVEDQRAADERIPFLLQTPAAVRFVSCEPLLGPVDLLRACERSADILTHRYLTLDEWGIDWLIVGGETGPGARPMHPDWGRSLRDQAVTAGVPFFFKAWGEWCPIEVLTDFHAPSRLVSFSGEVLEEYCGWGRDVPARGWHKVVRVGKKSAGRMLDGREWNEMPEVDRKGASDE